MPSPLFAASSTHPQVAHADGHQRGRGRYAKVLAMAIVAASLAVVGCDGATQGEQQQAEVQILDNKIVVSHDLIHTSIPERYQPSYNLVGDLVPVNSVDLTAPYHIVSSTLEVAKGDSVQPGQVVARLEAKVAENELPFIGNDFLEVYQGDKKIDAQSTQSSATKRTVKSSGTGSISGVGVAVSATSDTADDAQRSSAVDKPIQDSKTQSTETNTLQQANKSQRLVEVTLVLKSPIAGKVTNIQNTAIQNTAATQNTAAPKDTTESADNTKGATDEVNTSAALPSPIITVANTRVLQLIAQLPLETQSQLSVGKPVNFTVFDLHKEFTGQISHITPDANNHTLTVHAPLIAGENTASLLKPGMRASMSIEYGQIELGVRLPREAIHEANLQPLTKKNPRPTTPIHGYVWIVGQDQSLSYTPVQVVEYFADSDQFLVSGISNESLVCLADLPKDSDGKILSVQ